MPDVFQYDVFLSHNQADRRRVRRLAEWLPLQRGAPNSELGIARLFLSPAVPVGSDCVTLERSTVLFREPEDGSRRFIPTGDIACHRRS